MRQIHSNFLMHTVKVSNISATYIFIYVNLVKWELSTMAKYLYIGLN